MIIYLILNKNNLKGYIGQTIQKFHERYHGKKWWKYTDNWILKNSVEKHGIASFEVIFLHENISSIEELNRLEQLYIRNYNTLAPHGYNLDSGGKNKKIHISSLIKKSASNRKVEFKFRSPEGKIFEPVILKHFCKEYELSQSSMSNVAKGYRISYGKKILIFSHKGWTNANNPIEERSFISPYGKIFTIRVDIQADLEKFYKNNNLYNTQMNLVFIRKNIQHRGWTLFPDGFNQKTIIFSNGEKIQLFQWEIFNFCKKHNLIIKKFVQVWNGTMPYLSWKVEENSFKKFDNYLS